MGSKVRFNIRHEPKCTGILAQGLDAAAFRFLTILSPARPPWERGFPGCERHPRILYIALGVSFSDPKMVRQGRRTWPDTRVVRLSFRMAPITDALGLAAGALTLRKEGARARTLLRYSKLQV